mgnify:CR=1 FL=1
MMSAGSDGVGPGGFPSGPTPFSSRALVAIQRGDTKVWGSCFAKLRANRQSFVSDGFSGGFMRGLRVLIAVILGLSVLGLGACASEKEEPVAYKPVLYLYPQDDLQLRVGISIDGALTSSYPVLAPFAGEGVTQGEWSVSAHPDGTLRDTRGREYPSLFWEGRVKVPWKQNEGSVVARDEVVSFLERTLAAQGLSDREAADFITFWAPRMQDNEYSLVTFATDQYAPAVRYSFTDEQGREEAPDTFIRVFMVFSKADASTKTTPQEFTSPPSRRGFTAVEWGGTELE